jgi:HlyD family secretion protein
MIYYLKELYRHLPANIKRTIFFLQLMIFVVSILELGGVGSALPFVAVVSDPESVKKYEIARQLFDYVGVNDDRGIILTVGILMLIIFTLVNTFRIIVLHLMMKCSVSINNYLATVLFDYYMHQDYLFHTQNNSATLREKVFNETGRIGVVINSFFTIMNSGLVVVFISIAIFAINPSLAMVTGSILFVFYFIVYKLIQAKVKDNGTILSEVNYLNSKVINEAFNGIRDIKLLGKENLLVDKIQKGHYSTTHASKQNKNLASYPRFLLEIIVIFIMVGMLFLMTGEGQNMKMVLPTLSLYALGAYRLMPSLQTMFAGIAAIRERTAAFDNIWDDFHAALKRNKLAKLEQTEVKFERKIELSAIEFSYNEETKVINGVDLSIAKNTTVGFVGASGSGKTTTIDLILGFLQQQAGRVLIDGVEINKANLQSWRRKIGFVPQMIFLSDSTIAENIAFGEFDDEIDMQRVKKAAELAELAEFIETLPQEYKTEVGERGIQLSGGQRQRIGIARALYTDPEILVFDEATSALDGVTETAIIDAMHKFSHQKTIIMVAHRLTTVKECDNIFFFEKGKITQAGTYNELIEKNEYFRKMAKL